MKNVTTKEFLAQLLNMRKPGGRILPFLKAHCDSTGDASTMTTLAKEVGYRNYRAMNLHYGGLAKRLARAFRPSDAARARRSRIARRIRAAQEPLDQ
jgi:hypothetical protein